MKLKIANGNMSAIAQPSSFFKKDVYYWTMQNKELVIL